MRLGLAQVAPIWDPYSKASWTSLFMFLKHLKLNVSQTELIVSFSPSLFLLFCAQTTECPDHNLAVTHM